jgi:hypothetical protein
MLLLLETRGCDLPPAPLAAGAPRIVSSSVDPGPSGGATHALEQPIVLTFDRLLSPRTIHRGTFALSSGELAATPRLRYEPVERAVSLELDPSELRTDVEYLLDVRPGVSSWDGVAMTEGRVFRVRFARGGAERPRRSVAIRRDVAPLFRANCAANGCHGGEEPAMGLDLSTPEATLRSTVGVVARSWPSSAGVMDRGSVGWDGMLRVSPGEPALSFLLYKLLGDGPMRGARMPRGAAPLSRDAVLAVSAWIAAGARDDAP